MEPTFVERGREAFLDANPDLREEYEAERARELATIAQRRLLRKLIARRAELAMTQSELAKRIGVTRSYVSQMERMRAPISLGRLVQICAVLNCKIEVVEI